MALTGRQEEAAALVASDSMTEEQIAEKIGVTRRTIFNWRQTPEFEKRVNKLRADYRAAVRRKGIALKEQRITELDEQYNRLKAVRDARAREYKDEPLGGETGLVVRQVKLVKVYDAGDLVPWETDDELEGQPHGGALKRRRKPGLPDISIKKLLETGILPGAQDGIVFEIEDHKDGVLYSAKKSVEVVEWPIDTALLREMREYLKQVADETDEGDDADAGAGTITVTSIKYHQPPPAPADGS